MRLSNTLSNSLTCAGIIMILLGAYYIMIKAGIPYQDPPLDIQIQYTVNMKVGEVLAKDGIILTLLSIIFRIASWLFAIKK